MKDPQRLLAALAAGATVLLTAGAFWLSYAHLAALASAHGMAHAPDRAWAWPACVDMFIAVGELLVLRAALAHRVDPYAIALATLGSGASIALNVASTGAGAPPLDYVVSGVPPVAALLAFGALMRQVHERLVVRVPAGYTAAPEAAGVPDVQSVERLSEVPSAEVRDGAYPALELARETKEYHGAPAPLEAPGAGTDAEYGPALPVFPEPVMTVSPEAAAPAEPEGVPEDEYIEPDPEPDPGEGTPDEVLAATARLALADDVTAGRVPSIRALRKELGIGQARAQRVQRLLTTA